MPLVFVQRWRATSPEISGGTFYVDGALSIPGAINIYGDPAVYYTPGTYTLFDWTGTGSFPVPAQVSNISFSCSGRTVAVAPYVDGSTIKIGLN